MSYQETILGNDTIQSIRREIETLGERLGLNIGFWFVLPVLVIMTGLIIYPVVRVVWLSLHSSQGATQVWTGLENFSTILTADWFIPLLRRTILWTGLSVIGQIMLGLFVALLLNTKFRGRAFVRGLMLLPWVTPGVVAGLVWMWIYDAQFGILNQFLIDLGLLSERLAWIGHSDIALYAVIAAGIWKGFAFSMLMLLAGLQDIDSKLYDAARIDGAPWYARFRHITLPGLRSVLKIVLLLSVIWTFNYFTLIYVMTGGGPAGSTNILPLKVYQLSFSQFQFGLASALAIILFLIMVVWMAIYAKLLSAQGEEL